MPKRNQNIMKRLNGENGVPMMNAYYSLQKEYDELKDYLNETKCIVDQHMNLLDEQLEIKADSLKYDIDTNLAKLSSKLQDLRKKNVCDTLDASMIETILSKIKSIAEIGKMDENFQRLIDECVDLFKKAKESSKTLLKLRFEESNFIIDEHVLGNMKSCDSETELKRRIMTKIRFNINEYASLLTKCLVKKDKLIILGIKSGTHTKAILLHYDFDGKLTENKEYNCKSRFVSSYLNNIGIFLLCGMESGALDYYLIKLNHNMQVINFVSHNNLYNDNLLGFSNGKLYLYSKSTNCAQNSMIKIFDENLKYVDQHQSEVFNVTNLHHISFDNDKILVYNGSSISQYINWTKAKEYIIGSQQRLLILKDEFYFIYDDIIDRNILFKKDLESGKILARYLIELVGTEKITDISIDDFNNYVFLWCGKTNLIVIKVD